MEQIQADKLEIKLNVDFDKYAVIIKKSSLDDSQRLYYICFRDDLNNKNLVCIPTFFSKQETNIIEIWEMEFRSMKRNIRTEKIDEELELIIDEGEPEYFTVKQMPYAFMKQVEEIIEVIN